MDSNTPCKRAAQLFAAALLCLLAVVTQAQINVEAYRNYFLVGQFGEVCTMCEVIVLCEVGDQIPTYENIPERGEFTVYHLQTRTFWSQISTIWEWFVANFSQASLAARGHTRPAHQYVVFDNRWSPAHIIEARLVLEPGVVELGEHFIDRVDQSWHLSASGSRQGYCARMDLWDGLARIEANGPDPIP